MAKSYIEYLKEILASQEDTKKQQLQATDSEYEALKEQTKSERQKNISQLDASYGALVDAENVKKLIDERKIKEATANMGLTDSGLNRTQQTAVQLNHSNKVSGLFAQRMAQVDALKLATDEKLFKLENERMKKNSDIEQGFLETAQNLATDMYNNDITMEAKSRENELLAQQSALEAEMNQKLQELKKEMKEQEATYKATIKDLESKYKEALKNSASSKDDDEATLTDEQLPEGNLEEENPSYRKWTVEKLEKSLLTRKDLSDERKFDKSIPPYEEYLKEHFYDWLHSEKITQEEFDRLVEKYYLNI